MASVVRADEAGSLILLVCVYMALRNWVFPKWLHGNELRVLRLDVIFASALVILFTNSLGGVLSEFFFLYYFLSIGSALLLGAGPSVGLILTVIACYLPDFPRTSANQLLFGSSDVVPFCLRLLFLLGVVPISAYFAKSYLLSQKLQKKIFILTSQKKKYEDALESIQDDVIAWGAFRIRSALSTTKNYLDAVVSWDVVAEQYNQAYELARSSQQSGKGVVLPLEF